MIRKTIAFQFAASGVFILAGGSLHADEINVDSAIDRVKVFPRSAEVTRVASVSIPAGSHQLIIDDLPPSIDPARLQLSMTGGSIRLGNLQMEERFNTELISAEERRLQAELDDLQFERLALSDEIASVNTQLKLLDSLASGSLVSDEAALDGAGLTSLLETLLSTSSSARENIREAKRLRGQLDKEIGRKQAELDRVATRSRSQEVLSVAVEADALSDAQLKITYPMAQAGWSLLYESRLDTANEQLQLQRKVAVRQSSGEAWDDVEIEITTSRPSSNTRTPELESLYVGIYEPPPPRQQNRTLQSRSRSGDIEEVVVTGSFVRSQDSFSAASPVRTINAAVEATEYLVNFDVPGRVSVAANDSLQIFHIDQRELDIELVTRTVPAVDATAYLEVRFENEESIPIQGGSMQLYRDGTYIGQQYVGDILPQEEVSLPYGADDRVRVEVKSLESDSRDGGTFRRSAVEDHRTRYEITNFHAFPIRLEVLGRIPVAQHESIDVGISDDATPADEFDVDGEPGVLMWTSELEANQTEDILHSYTVSHPRDENLDYYR